jgi:PQQ-like domain
MAFGREGQRLWAIKLDAPAVGTPVIGDGTIWLLDRAGRLYRRALADGALRERLDLGFLPAGGLLMVGSQTIAATARGTVQPLQLNPSGPRR